MNASRSSLPTDVENAGDLIVKLAEVPSVETWASAVIGGFGTVTAVLPVGTSRFALSSTARLSKLIDPAVNGVQEYDQLAPPFARCQLCPPSVDTSTLATTPPPTSMAVPVTFTGIPNWRVAPLAGEVIVDVGGIVSVDFVGMTNPG
jgi:hypothetical protein